MMPAQFTKESEVDQALALAKQDIVAALENLHDPHVTDNLHRLGVLGKGNVEMATTILTGRLKMLRGHAPNDEAQGRRV